MRRFSTSYLDRTRAGMWEDSRAALADLELDDCERILDVGCGTGELSAVLAAESDADAEVVGVDADPDLLAVARERTGLPVAAGDATRLPVRAGAFDLVVCQALLVNLPDPAAAVREFRRASSGLVAAVEPDNADVRVDSTVADEPELDRRLRDAFRRGVETDVAPGDRIPTLFREAGLADVRTRRYRHEKRIRPPYDGADLRHAKRMATGAGVTDNEAELRRALSDDAYDALRRAWREAGRTAVDQMRDERYRRTETVPFDVTVGRVPPASSP